MLCGSVMLLGCTVALAESNDSLTGKFIVSVRLNERDQLTLLTDHVILGT